MPRILHVMAAPGAPPPVATFCILPADQLLAYLAVLIHLVIRVGARTVLSKVAGRVTKSTLNVVKLGFFWVLVFWAAKFIAES